MANNGMKSPGWKKLLGLCRAIKKRELTKDDFGLYDVEREHQLAYNYLVSLYTEDIGERAAKCINDLHLIRKFQIKNKDYVANKDGKYRTPTGREPGTNRIDDDSIRKAVNMIMNGGTFDSASSAVGCAKSNLGEALRKRYKFSAIELIQTRNAKYGERYFEMKKTGKSWGQIAKEENCGEDTVRRRVDGYRKFLREGKPLEMKFSDEMKKLMNWE